MESQPILLEGQSRPVQTSLAGFYKNKPRPNSQSAEVLAMVANDLMPHILQWGKWDENDREAQEVAAQLLEVLGGRDDGYKMAKTLEDRHYWDSDAELVDILEGADFHSANRTAVMAWITDNGVKANFEAGRQVEVKTSPRESLLRKGEIAKIYEDGNYCVMVPELGHVREGLGTHGLIFSWEDVEAWNGAESV
jgi:hypothetical protein